MKKLDSISLGVTSIFFSAIYDCFIFLGVGFDALSSVTITILIIVGFIINYILNFLKHERANKIENISLFRCCIIDSTLASLPFAFLGLTNTSYYTNLNSLIFTPFFYLPLIYTNKNISKGTSKKIFSVRNLVFAILYCVIIYEIL